jgi:hypothetical protein
MSLFNMIGYVSGLDVFASNAVLVPSPLEHAADSATVATTAALAATTRRSVVDVARLK